MSAGLKFISSVVENGAGNSLLGIDPDLFIEEQERAVFDFVRTYYRSYREVPTPSIVRENTGIRLPRAEGALRFHEENLRERLIFESMREDFTTYRAAMQSGDTAAAVESLERTVQRIRRRSRQTALKDISVSVEEVVDRLRRVQGMGGMSGVPTPWESFNRITCGYQAGDLVTWVGRTAMGKTQTLLAQAEAAYDAGYSALFVTTEMGSEQIARRWVAMKMGLNPEVLKSGMVSTHLLRRIREFNANLVGRERFRILSIGTQAKMTSIDAAVDEMAPDIVFLDGAYLMKPTSSSPRSQVEMVSAVFDEIKQATIDQNIPYVVNTQFNRQAGRGGRDGSLETIGMSDTIARHSSIVVAVKPGPTDDPMASRELDFLKGREGEQGKIYINFRFKPTDLSELSEEEIANADTPSMTADGDWN